MTRNLLILSLFLMFSFGATVAQSDIFVRQNPAAESEKEDAEEEKPVRRSIFLRRDTSKNSAVKNVVKRFETRLNVKGVRKQIERDMKTLAYWKQRETRPQNDKELRSYAFAMRFNQREQMLKSVELRRVEMAKIRQKHQAEFQAHLLSKTPNPQAVAAADARIAADKALAEAERKGVNRVRTDLRGHASASTESRERRVYTRNKNSLEKPKRVFRDYR